MLKTAILAKPVIYIVVIPSQMVAAVNIWNTGRRAVGGVTGLIYIAGICITGFTWTHLSLMKSKYGMVIIITLFPMIAQ